MMMCSPQTLLSCSGCSQSHRLSWPVPGRTLTYSNQYVLDHDTLPMKDRERDSSTHRSRPIRVYRPSTYDISGFLHALERIQHRSVDTTDMHNKIPSDSVPPFTQEVLYLAHNGYFCMKMDNIEPMKLISHTSKLVTGFCFAWLIADLAGNTMLQRTFSSRHSESDNGVIGLCSIFYLPLGSLSAIHFRQMPGYDTFHPCSSTPESNLNANDISHNNKIQTILSEIYQNCREYHVRHCVLTDGYDSKVIELFNDSYMDSGPYDIVLLSNNEDDRPIPLTLGGLLWDVLSSICYDARESMSMQGQL